MKLAYELSTLTGTQVLLLVASETGHVYTFATRKLQPMITSETGKGADPDVPQLTRLAAALRPVHRPAHERHGLRGRRTSRTRCPSRELGRPRCYSDRIIIIIIIIVILDHLTLWLQVHWGALVDIGT
ncbi:hypothetical protein CRUP_007338 [Coryphaenoides rupestris]|nr:hypothetical protein CRUP_007338 [Coryphaenoides rupestris]